MKHNKIEDKIYIKLYNKEVINNNNNRNARLLYPYIREHDHIISSNFKINCTVLG